MPIYEYRCQDCGHQLEKLQRMNDAPLRDCPQCSQPALRRLISAAGFRLKGGGWYETDFKQGQKRNLAESAGAGGAEAKSDATGSSADKPAGETKKEGKAEAAPATS